MKNVKFIFSVATAAMFLGCSDLGVDQETALSENFPSDFKYMDYMEIHPALRFYQIKAGIDAHNKPITEAITKLLPDLKKEVSSLETTVATTAANCEAGDAVSCLQLETLNLSYKVKSDSVAYLEHLKEAYTADTTRYFGDSTTLKALMLHPYVGKALRYVESDWAKSWNITTQKDSVVATTALDTIKFFIENKEKKDSLVVYIADASLPRDERRKGKITYDTEGKITEIQGFKKSDLTEDTTLTISADMTFLKKSDNNLLDTLSLDTLTVDVFNKGLTKDKKTALNGFNMIDTLDAAGNVVILNDLEEMEKIPVDSNALKYQYTQIGRLHGWAYRYCKDDELSNPRMECEDYEICDLMVDPEAAKECYARVQCSIYPTTDKFCFDKTNSVIRKIIQ